MWKCQTVGREQIEPGRSLHAAEVTGGVSAFHESVGADEYFDCTYDGVSSIDQSDSGNLQNRWGGFSSNVLYVNVTHGCG